ncbi:MAG: GNAT family N-acetyltransferase [Halocynthiibacter sp.]
MRYETIITQPLIETERFSLRPVLRSDIGLLQMYTADKRVAEATTSIPHPLPPGTTEAFVARAMSAERLEDIWIMDGNQKGQAEVFGVIGLKPMDRKQSEVGYWVAPAFWNSGLASEAVQALIAANPQQCKTLFAQVFQDNPASARVLTKAGFEYLGDAETHCVARAANVATWTYLKKFA